MTSSSANCDFTARVVRSRCEICGYYPHFQAATERRIVRRPCARCEEPGEHLVCDKCDRTHGLGRALAEGTGPPGKTVWAWNVCSDAVRVALELMGDDS